MKWQHNLKFKIKMTVMEVISATDMTVLLVAPEGRSTPLLHARISPRDQGT